MSRRYLTKEEALFKLNKGKDIEAFLGGSKFKNNNTIQRLNFYYNNHLYIAELWEVYDQGNENYLDLYTFENISQDFDLPSKKYQSQSFDELLKSISLDYMNISDKLVNFGIAQDEYLDYLKMVK